MNALANISTPILVAKDTSYVTSISASNSSLKASSKITNGYNPINGNYYGDGSNLRYDEHGRAIANINTGAYYKDNNIALGRSDEDFKTQLDFQLQHVNSYITNAKKNSNQNAIEFAEENKRRILNREETKSTLIFDGRGYGYSGNLEVKGRDYTYDPYSDKSTGNVKLEDPNYDLMRDSDYNHFSSFSDEIWDNYFREMVDSDNIKNTTIDKQWLLSFKDNWNKYRLLNPNEVSPWGAKALENIAPLPDGTRMPRYMGYENGQTKWDSSWYEDSVNQTSSGSVSATNVANTTNTNTNKSTNITNAQNPSPDPTIKTKPSYRKVDFDKYYDN